MIFIVISFLLLLSCKKENIIHNGNGNLTEPKYSNLAVGNYWIYQRYRIEPNQPETALDVFDSCYIELDTLINGYNYYKFVDPYMLQEERIKYLRDSLHYIVDSAGVIVFSYIDFTSVFQSYYVFASETDTVSHVIINMEEGLQEITTPAGTFSTLNAKETYYMYPNWSNNGSERYKNHYYSSGIGVVSETMSFFAADPSYIERRLVRYHVQ